MLDSVMYSFTIHYLEVRMKILVVEDDKKIASFIEKGLENAGFEVDLCEDGLGALAQWKTTDYDAAIVDIMLPNLDGLSLIGKVRELNISTPVIILSAKQSVDDRIKGLQVGGDDYMIKPFSFSELLARVNAQIRRTKQSQENSVPTELTVGDLHLNIVTRRVTRNGEPIELQPKEFTLLELLMSNAGHIVTKSTILEHVYDYNFDPQTNIVDVLVCRLRNKIDKDFGTKTLKTVRGMGYVIEQD